MTTDELLQRLTNLRNGAEDALDTEADRQLICEQMVDDLSSIITDLTKTNR